MLEGQQWRREGTEVGYRATIECIQIKCGLKVGQGQQDRAKTISRKREEDGRQQQQLAVVDSSSLQQWSAAACSIGQQQLAAVDSSKLPRLAACSSREQKLAAVHSNFIGACGASYIATPSNATLFVERRFVRDIQGEGKLGGGGGGGCLEAWIQRPIGYL